MAEITEDEAIGHLLGDLDAEGTRRVFDDVLAGGPAVELVGGYRGALEAFALASSPVREPAENLRARVLEAAVGGDADARAPQRKVVSFPWLPWLVAACVAVVAGLGLLSWNSERGRLTMEIESLRDRADASDLRVRELASQVDQSFKAFIVWDDVRGTGVLKVENLPALGADGDYQLWVVSEGYENPLDGGVFDTEGGRAEMQIVTKELAAEPAPAKGVTLFAISRERPGGVPVSETKDFVLTAAY